LAILDTLNQLSDVLKLQGVSTKQIEQAEKRLGLHFSEEYKAYTSAFGAIAVNGSEYTGVVSDPNLDVVRSTLEGREVTPQAQMDWYVVKDPHFCDILIWQDYNGFIYQTSPESQTAKICNSLEEYIQKHG